MAVQGQVPFIEIERVLGTTVVIRIPVKTGGAVQSLSGATVYFEGNPQGGGGAIAYSSPSSGITITDAAGGIATLTIPASATSSLTVKTIYDFDIWMKNAADERYPLCRGTLTFLLNQVTIA